MKVCLVTGEYPPMIGGVADYTALLKDSVEKLGVEYCVVTSKKAGRQDSPAIFATMSTWGFRAWPRIRSLIGDSKVDLVHVQFQRGAFDLDPRVYLLPFWLRHLGYRVVTTLHDLKEPYLFPKAGRFRRLALLALIRASSACICTNSEDFGQVSLLAPGHHIKLIPLGSHITANLPFDFGREALRTELGVKQGDWLLCYFGLLSGSKGVEYLLEAVRLLRGEGLPVKLLIVGGGLRDGLGSNIDYEKRVHALSEEPDLMEAISWAGYVPEERASALFRASDICILPFSEGASFRRSSLISAIAHGLPLVTTAPICRQETRLRLVDGDNAMLAEPRSAASLANAIRRVIESPELRKRLQHGAIELSQEFSWQRVAQQTAELYEAVCAEA